MRHVVLCFSAKNGKFAPHFYAVFRNRNNINININF